MRYSTTKLLALATLCMPLILHAQHGDFSFSVLMHVLQDSPNDATLRAAIDQAQNSAPAFIVVNGIKTADEACTDRRFRQRKAIMEAVNTPVFLSMAGSDWVSCRDTRRRSNAIERLATLREQLYGDISWNGGRQLSITRQSSGKAYRSYSENTRWEMGGILFATIHLPAPNNRYLVEAGRNGEFEDRQIANRSWLRRLITVAKRDRVDAIVLFCDGTLLPYQTTPPGLQRDGFAEVRQQLKTLAPKFNGPILVVQSRPPQARYMPETPVVAEFVWNRNLGYVNLPAGHTAITVNPALPTRFEIRSDEGR